MIISHRQRYYVRHREGGQTSVYIGSIPKAVLKDKETYSQHVKKLLDEGVYECVCEGGGGGVPYCNQKAEWGLTRLLYCQMSYKVA